MRADDFIQMILQLIAVPVPNLRTVAGKMKQQPVSGFGARHQPVQPVENTLFRGAAVHQHPDILDGKSEILQENIPHVGRVIDAAMKV
jgi:hypothetical protein